MNMSTPHPSHAKHLQRLSLWLPLFPPRDWLTTGARDDLRGGHERHFRLRCPHGYREAQRARAHYVMGVLWVAGVRRIPYSTASTVRCIPYSTASTVWYG